MATNASPRCGMITAVPNNSNGYRYVISTDDGDTVYLAGPGAPKDGQVGDLGTVEYQAGRNYGIFVWSPAPIED